MAKVTQYGQEGRYLVYVDYKGTFLPITTDRVIQRFKKIQKIEVSKEDILVCSYPKSGTHWMWEICEMLLKNTTTPMPDVMEDHSLDVHTPEHFASQKPPRVFVTHLQYHDIPKSFKDNGCKIVYISRDPRAVVVSLWNHLTKIKNTCTLNLKEFVEYFLQGKMFFNNWRDHILSWDKVIEEKSHLHQFLVLTFEDVKQDVPSTILRLNEFLGTGLPDATCYEIAKNTEIANLRKVKSQIENNQYRDFYIDDIYPIYRKGTVDSWKNSLTVSQNEEFQQLHKGVLQCRNIKLKSLL